jgi:hypothetical protein
MGPTGHLMARFSVFIIMKDAFSFFIPIKADVTRNDLQFAPHRNGCQANQISCNFICIANRR